MFTKEQVQAAVQVVMMQRDQLTEQLVNMAMTIAALEAKVAELSPQAPSQD
jgi:chaperonin cofactor prefoldin